MRGNVGYADTSRQEGGRRRRGQYLRLLLSRGLSVNCRSDTPAVFYGYSRVVLTGRVRRTEKSFYGAERAIDEKLIRDRYRG